jgi:hypothetical protein
VTGNGQASYSGGQPLRALGILLPGPFVPHGGPVARLGGSVTGRVELKDGARA